MEVETEITLEDYRAFETFVRNILLTGNGQPKQADKKRMFNFLMVVSAGAVVGIMLGVMNIKLHTPTMLLFGILVPLLFIVIFKKLQRKAVPSEGGHILGKKIYIFGSDGIKYISENYESLTRWAGVKSLKVTKDYFFIMVDTTYGFILPKRSLSGKQEEEELRTLIHENLGLDKQRQLIE